MSGSGLGTLITDIEGWGQAALTTIEDDAGGIAIKFVGASFTAVGKAAQAYKDAITAGKSPAEAWTAAYNVLSAAEGVALTDAELTIADDIISLLGGAPKA